MQRQKGDDEMKILQRFLMGLGTVLLLALSLQLVAPKAVHAVVSTLVTVANTATNPVASRNVDNPATYPFSANLCINVNSFCDPSLSQVFVVPAATSTGVQVKRLVLQGVSGDCQGDPATTALLDGIQISSFAPEDTINPPSGPYRFIRSRRLLARPPASVISRSPGRYSSTRPPETPCIPTYGLVLQPRFGRAPCSVEFTFPAIW
jgi:hypothetical protein